MILSARSGKRTHLNTVLKNGEKDMDEHLANTTKIALFKGKEDPESHFPE